MKKYVGLLAAVVVGAPLGTILMVQGRVGAGIVIALFLGLAAAVYDTRETRG